MMEMLKKISRYNSLYLILFLIFFLSACDFSDNSDEGCEPAPLSCDETPPTDGNLFVQVTINGKNTHVPVYLFRGDFEHNDLVLDTILTTSGMNLTLPIIDEGYSAVAEYIQNDGDTVIAIDGDDLDFDEDEYCDKTCYGSASGRIDVRLHWPKIKPKNEPLLRTAISPQ